MSDDYSKLSEKKNFRLKNIPFYLIITSLILSIHILHITVHFSGDYLKLFQLTFIAFIEASLEGFLLCLLGSYLSRFSIFGSLAIVLAAFFPVFHLVDMILERLFNVGFWETLSTVLSESMENMLELLLATNISLGIWFLGFVALMGIGAFFIYVYKKTNNLSFKIGAKSQPAKIFPIFLSLLCGYFPLKSSIDTSVDLHLHELKVLPFKHLLSSLSSHGEAITLVHSQQDSLVAAKSNYDGHIFIFVVESLRNDAIYAQTAPHLTQLGKDNHRHSNCIASANGTHLSWYSLFFSKSALLWKNEQSRGSPFLKDLKNDGYDVQVLSSARLSYYGMDKLIMGKNHEFVNEYYCPKNENTMSAFEADKACFTKLNSLISEAKKKTAFIVFLDASHFGYSLPEKSQFLFEPFADSIPYFSTVFSSVDVNLIKNRYLNTVNSIDDLFGGLFDRLKRDGLFDKALIMVTADHGEEFFEKGQLFHASHLSFEQLHIPFILKVPHGYQQRIGFSKILSHKDMFPLLRSVLSDKSFEDQSWQMSSRFNFAQRPKEVAITTLDGKAIFKVNSKTQKLELLKNVDLKDAPKDEALEIPKVINLDMSSL